MTDPKNSVLEAMAAPRAGPQTGSRVQGVVGCPGYGFLPSATQPSVAPPPRLAASWGLVQPGTAVSPAPVTAHGSETAALRVSFLQRQK